MSSKVETTASEVANMKTQVNGIQLQLAAVQAQLADMQAQQTRSIGTLLSRLDAALTANDGAVMEVTASLHPAR